MGGNQTVMGGNQTVIREPDGDGREPDCDGREPDSDGREPDHDGRDLDSDGREPDSDGREPDGDGREPRTVTGDGREPDGDGREPDQTVWFSDGLDAFRPSGLDFQGFNLRCFIASDKVHNTSTQTRSRKRETNLACARLLGFSPHRLSVGRASCRC